MITIQQVEKKMAIAELRFELKFMQLSKKIEEIENAVQTTEDVPVQEGGRPSGVGEEIRDNPGPGFAGQPGGVPVQPGPNDQLT